MKARLIVFETKLPDWVRAGRDEYLAKLKPFMEFEAEILKSPSADREDAEIKRRKEGELLLKRLESNEQLILFDEKGKTFRSSEDFADVLNRQIEQSGNRLVFCIGGAYGFSEAVRERANAKWSLSPLTMNHWVAQVMALEQLYRAFTILRRIPYHNR